MRYCPKIVTNGKIKCHATKRRFSSRIKVCCQSSNLVYCLSCKTCGKQYVGQTKRRVCKRLYEHFYNINKAIQAKQTNTYTSFDPVGAHFSRDDHHGVNDVTVHILAFISVHPESVRALQVRLATEHLWIHRMRSPAPRGLNIFD